MDSTDEFSLSTRGDSPWQLAPNYVPRLADGAVSGGVTVSCKASWLVCLGVVVAGREEGRLLRRDSLLRRRLLKCEAQDDVDTGEENVPTLYVTMTDEWKEDVAIPICASTRSEAGVGSCSVTT